jgi:hypothetical protein
MRSRPAGIRRTRRMTIATSVAVLMVLAFAATNRAGAEPIAGGKTRLKLDAGLYALFGKKGVRVSRLGPATVHGRLVTLPIGRGLIDPGSGDSTIVHAGGIRLRHRDRSLTLRAPLLDTSSRTLRVEVGGKPILLATARSLDLSRAGFGETVATPALRLTAKGARLLNRKLRLAGTFRMGETLGAASSAVKPEWVGIVGGSLQLNLDAGTLAKLRAAGVEVAPFQAQMVGSNPPAYALPLTGGSIFPSLSDGGANTESGLTLTRAQPPTTLSWTVMSVFLDSDTLVADGNVHTGSTVKPLGGAPIAALDRSGATVQVDPDARTATISNMRATLEPDAVAAINEAFAPNSAPLVAGGDLLGSVSVAMRGK